MSRQFCSHYKSKDIAWCVVVTLQWRHNGRDSVSNHQPRECLLSRLIRRRSKKTSKLRVTGLCAGNSPETGEFPARRASNAKNVSIWWRHHGFQWNSADNKRMYENTMLLYAYGIMDNSYPRQLVPKYELSWVLVVLGTSCPGYELSWVRVVQIPAYAIISDFMYSTWRETRNISIVYLSLKQEIKIVAGILWYNNRQACIQIDDLVQ